MASGNSMNGGDVGALVSVISRNGVRYEARGCGTEGRRRDGPQIPPSYAVYEIAQFCRSDIQELQVKSVPPAQQEEQTCSSSTNGKPQHRTMDRNKVCLNDVNKKTQKDEPRGRITKTMMDSTADKTTMVDSRAAFKKLDATPQEAKRMKLDTEVSATPL